MAEIKSNSMGVASLVLGIVSLVLMWVPFIGLISGIIGLVLALKQKKIMPNGLATGGLVTSIIGMALSTIYLIFWLIWGAFFISMMSYL